MHKKINHKRLFKLFAWICKLGLLVTIAEFSSCVESFTPEVTNYDSLLVIDALITNEPGPYTVRLSRSTPYNYRIKIYEEDATVIIYDDQGNTEVFTETKKGQYTSSANGIRGVVGRSYKIYIQTNDGEEYESEYLTLKRSPEIDNIYYTFNTDQDNQGVQFYLNSHDSLNETKYYRFEFSETWEYNVPVAAPGYENKRFCWRFDSSKFIATYTTENLQEDKIIDFPIGFITNKEGRIYKKYSMLAKQYSLTQSGYRFFQQLESLNQDMGSLFDPTPYSIYGNIKNIADETQPVLGYFIVSAVSTKRVFLTRDEIPKEIYLTNGFEYCQTMKVYLETPNAEDEVARLVSYGFVNLGVDIEEDKAFYILVSDKKCIDCTLTGTNIKPPYWDEE